MPRPHRPPARIPEIQGAARELDGRAGARQAPQARLAGSFTDDQKREAVIALASRKASAQEVADAVGVTRAVLYKWKNQLLGEEAPCKMEAVPKDMVDDVDALRSQAAELQEQIKRLELRKAILEGAVELLGKDQGIDPGMLTNREKALIANSLRPARKLMRYYPSST